MIIAPEDFYVHVVSAIVVSAIVTVSKVVRCKERDKKERVPAIIEFGKTKEEELSNDRTNCPNYYNDKVRG